VPSFKIAYRISSQIVFRKSVSLFKSKIEKGSYDKGIESFKNWTDWAQTKIEEHRISNPVTLPKIAPGTVPPQMKVSKIVSSQKDIVKNGADQNPI